jgi:putative methionine-R-sulfoxide reductase with GAF domain
MAQRPTPRDFEAELDELRALTDASLRWRDAGAHLDELLDRARTVLDADTVSVLVLNAAAAELEARAARGLEEEVRQGVRIPLGHGFAGRIAATKAPVLLERVDETTVSNPILWEKGIEVMLGVPLFSGDDVLGVLHVGRLRNEPFTAADVELLQIVADRIAVAVQTQVLASEHHAAYVLERSLMPPQLPSAPGLELAARYAPSEHRAVGGDWYDVFTMPSGHCWLVVGDIAGHGLEAAVVMGRIRTALRAYALLELPPERVLELVDRKISHFELGTIATVAIAVVDPDRTWMHLASAGHLPPVLAQPREPAELLEFPVEPLLGGVADAARSSHRVALEPGAMLLLYTDGVVERRREPLDQGLERLRAAVTALEPARVTAEVMLRLIGNRAPDDDVALLAMRRAPASTD